MTFPGKNKKQQKKKAGGGGGGGGALHPEGGYNRVYYFVADGIITGGA